MRGSTRFVWVVVGLGVLAGCSDEPETFDTVSMVDVSLGKVQGAAETPTVLCESPADFFEVVLNNPSDTTTIPIVWSTDSGPELADGTYTLAWFIDTDEPAGTTQTVAPIDVELGFGQHLVSLALVLPDGSFLETPTSRCSINLRITSYCFDDDDCDDSYTCNTPTCTPAGGGLQVCAFGPPPFAGCCQHDFECPAESVCNADTHTCESCAVDAQCDDGNACTVDTCKNGTCFSAKEDPTCCDCDTVDVDPIAVQCAQASGVCFTATCDCEKNACELTEKQNPLGKCCETGDNDICADGDPCTVDECVANVCRNTQTQGGVTGCCTSDLDCNDGNPCTTDACHVDLNTCIYQPIGGLGCCTQNDDCDDGNPATWDACIANQCVFTENFDYCVPPEVSLVVINELMIDPSSVTDTEGEWIELYNRTADPIDITGWTLTELGDSAVVATLGEGASLQIPPKSYFVLCRNPDAATNGGITCDAGYSENYALSKAEDQVILMDGAGGVHDQVEYDGGPNFPSPDGGSIALRNPQEDNNLGASWKASFAPIPGSADLGTPGAENNDVFAIFVMAQCHEQPSDNPCTIDTCVDNTCLHVPTEGCCNTPSDCEVPTGCHEAQCVDNACLLSVIPAPACCLADGECNDTQVCTLDRCIGNQCKHGPDPIKLGCCTTDTDCGGSGNPCVLIECDEVEHTCGEPTLLGGAGCCPANTYPEPADPSQCDDGDPSTVDTCKDFQCLSIPDPNYCEAQPGDVGVNNCHLDGNPCTDASCDLATKTCTFAPVGGDCCTSNDDCSDPNPCTANVCNLKTGTCTFDWIAGCCLQSQAAEHCDDDDPCTTDLCASLASVDDIPGEFYGKCRSVKIDPGCCTEDANCNDGDACTDNLCDVTLKKCTYPAVELPDGQLCCDGANPDTSIEEQCEDSNACTVPSCGEDHLCEFAAVPPNEFGSCCDLDSPGAGTEAEQCDDANGCTLDKCVFGRCRHLVTGDVSCCTLDSECDDANTCTTDTCAEINGALVCKNTLIECDDGKFCNGEEMCSPGLGCIAAPGTAPDQSDGIFCTVDACDEATDTITHTPVDAACDDGKFCNGTETCDGTLDCQDGEPPAPTGIASCAEASCNEATDSFNVVGDNSLCDDGQSCNGLEICDPTKGCKKGDNAIPVDDGIACTVDACDEATFEPIHLPDNSLCDDSLVCTEDECLPESGGCASPLKPGFCLIAGTCHSSGATNPVNGCEYCDPIQSTVSWTLKPTSPEVCNGIDDDCDGLTDEGTDGTALFQGCANACGQLGVELCTGGVFGDCSAPKLTEICDDGVDNDCDGEIDTDCGKTDKPAVAGAEVTFFSSLGQVENLTVDNGDGTYTSAIRDLANPNLSGIARADAYGNLSALTNYSTLAAPIVEVEAVNMRDTLYADNAGVQIAVQARDSLGRPVAQGTAVKVVMSGASIPAGASKETGCSTDAKGRCIASWTAPSAVFESGASIFATVTVGPVSQPPLAFTVVPRPDVLVVQTPGAGLQLPLSPRFTNDTFQVPVYVNSGSSTLGAYDIRVSFDKFELQATALSKGGCAAFNDPVSNLVGDANATGTLKFNSLNSGTGEPCAAGAKIHVATITFKVLPGLPVDDPTGAAVVTCLVQDLFDNNFNQLVSGKVGDVAGPEGVGTSGEVTAWSNKIMGIVAGVPDAQLLNWKPITGAADGVQVDVVGYRRDYTQSFLSTDPKTDYGSLDGAIASVSLNGFVTAGAGAGETIIFATHEGATATARVKVLQPGSVEIELTDDTLQPIAGAITPVGSQLYQTTRMRAKVAWFDEVAQQWEQDITSLFDTPKIVLSGGLSYNTGKKVIAGTTEGSYALTLHSGLGTPVATTPIEVSTTAPATCTSLSVIAPCEVLLTGFEPPNPSVTTGDVDLEATVFAYMNTYQQTCQAQVYANYDDGSRMLVTGTLGVAVSSQAPGIVSATTKGVLTAESGGLATIDAAWTMDGAVLCTGTGAVLVDLPAPTGITITPAVTKLAVDAADPAATIKGLPTQKSLKLTVTYADGSSLDFTNHSSTTWDADSEDPAGLISVTPAGVVSSTGAGAGPATVSASVALYPALGSGTATVIVVGATGITAEVYEPYSPTLPRVTDHTFSFIEGTTTRQDGLFEVVLDYSDGSSSEITSDNLLSVDPVVPGTTTLNGAVVVFDKANKSVDPVGPGTVDVIFEYAGLLDKISGFTVDDLQEGIAILNPSVASGATFTGIKDVGTTTTKVWGIFNDGTRRRFWADRFITGLLSFASTVPSAATVQQNGVATIHANQSTVFTVDIVPGVDIGTSFDPPAEVAIDCNLAAGCGDFDLGDTVGLAFKDRAPGETFTLQGRLNTCGAALGAFDVNLTYATTVLKITGVDAAGGAVGAVFSSNYLSEPGQVLINASFNPLSGIVKGPDMPLFEIHYEAVKGGAGISTMAGTAQTVVALDGISPIGAPTPRAVIAAFGDLDPQCGVMDPDDVDGSCTVDARDVRLLQQTGRVRDALRVSRRLQ